MPTVQPRVVAPKGMAPGAPNATAGSANPSRANAAKRRMAPRRAGWATKKPTSPSRANAVASGEARPAAAMNTPPIQGRLWPQGPEEREKAEAAGHDLSRVLTTSDLVAGEDVFFCATGITEGDLVSGVRYNRGAVATSSIVMRSKSGTIRVVESLHQLSKLRAYASVDFDRN